MCRKVSTLEVTLCLCVRSINPNEIFGATNPSAVYIYMLIVGTVMTSVENLIHLRSHKPQQKSLFHGRTARGVILLFVSTLQSTHFVRDPAFESEPRSRHCSGKLCILIRCFLFRTFVRVRAEVRSVLKTDPHAPASDKPLNPVRFEFVIVTETLT